MPAEQRLMDHLYIKVDGTDLTREAMNDLLEVVVDTSLRLPDAFTIRLHDEGLRWVDEGPFGLGKEIEISAQPEAGGQSSVLLKGEITAVEPEFGDGTMATLTVRGYDRSHRLHRGTHSQAYLQMTASDLASRIAQEAGLRADVDATTQVHEHVLQHNQTHMEFLSTLAQRIGYEFYVQDRTLFFKKPSRNGSALDLEWGRQLRSFGPRLTLAEQVDEVIVKGWDPKTRQAITGQATRGQAEPKTGETQTGSQLASSAFGSARRLIVDQIVRSQTEADTLAQALCDEMSGAFIEAEGQCYGQPELRAGRFVNLTALGRRFSGTYFVTAATHIYRAEAGYVTSFSIHGRRPETLYSLLERVGSEGPALGGPVIGIVTNNNDPDGQGRVKVKFPWLSDDVESTWARLASSGAGAERGIFWLPEVNDEVLVVFEHGDMAKPFVVGGLWNGQDKPPLPASQAVQSGEVQQRILKTRAGHKLTFIDGSGKGIVIETAGGHRLTLADQDKKVVLQTAGGLTVTLDDSQNQITLDSGGNLTVKSGANLTIEATGSLELKGQTFSLNGTVSGEVKGGTSLDVKGGIVRIN